MTDEKIKLPGVVKGICYVFGSDLALKIEDLTESISSYGFEGVDVETNALVPVCVTARLIAETVWRMHKNAKVDVKDSFNLLTMTVEKYLDEFKNEPRG